MIRGIDWYNPPDHEKEYCHFRNGPGVSLQLRYHGPRYGRQPNHVYYRFLQTIV